jgi:hypothetical protein
VTSPRGVTWVRALCTLFALALLNAALTFDNLWPTPAIVPSPALSLEFLALVGVLLIASGSAPRTRRRIVVLAALLYTLLAFGRYAEVTMPALFGRPINLYWDGKHIPGLLALAWKQTPLWQSTAVVAATALLVLLVHRILHGAARLVAESLAAATPAARQIAAGMTALLGTTALAVLLLPTLGALALGPRTHLRDYVVQPVAATLLRQGLFVATALSPDRSRALPAGPPFTGNLAGLHGADVILVFLESYGATAFDNHEYSRQLQPRRKALADVLAASGRLAVSAFVRSPTFGGGSWLAHASLLSGVDVSDPGDYDLLLTTRRPTLVSHFRSHGYGTLALMPGIRADWPEGSFYGYDALLDSRGIDYQGPEFGYWRIPDQFSIARLAQRIRAPADPQPKFVVFPTVTSHIPFGPVPPYQEDWSRLTAATPFAPGAVSLALSHHPDWLDLGPAYVRTLSYSFDWVTGFLAQPATRDYLMILVGDHQPAASVSGQDATWDVPVHLITTDENLAQRFAALGFTPGLEPSRPALGAMSDLTRLLLRGLALQ